LTENSTLECVGSSCQVVTPGRTAVAAAMLSPSLNASVAGAAFALALLAGRAKVVPVRTTTHTQVHGRGESDNSQGGRERGCDSDCSCREIEPNRTVHRRRRVPGARDPAMSSEGLRGRSDGLDAARARSRRQRRGVARRRASGRRVTRRGAPSSSTDRSTDMLSRAGAKFRTLSSCTTSSTRLPAPHCRRGRRSVHPGFVADAALAQQLAEIGVILLMFGSGSTSRLPI
jgi:hypothetical protein